MDQQQQPLPGPLDGLSQKEKLTRREHQVLVLMSQSFINRTIATKLDISIKTVEKYRSAIYDKLGVHDVLGAVRAGLRLTYLSYNEWLNCDKPTTKPSPTSVPAKSDRYY